MKKLVAILSLMLSTSTFANAKFPEVSCWDGTFGYNAMTVHRESGKVVLGLSGHQLGPIDFGSTFQEHIDLPEWGDNQNALFMALSDVDCVEDAKSIECTRPRPRRSFFVKKNLRDIDGVKEVISEVTLEALSFKVEIHNDFISVEADISDFGNPISLSKSFPIRNGNTVNPCENQGTPSIAKASEAPSRLLQFIKN